MGMVDRIHNDTTHRWTDSHMALTAGLADGHVFMIEISNLADRRHTFDVNQANFTRRQLYMCVTALFRYQLSCRTCAPRHLTAFAGPQLNVVNGCAERNILQRK